MSDVLCFISNENPELDKDEAGFAITKTEVDEELHGSIEHVDHEYCLRQQIESVVIKIEQEGSDLHSLQDEDILKEDCTDPLSVNGDFSGNTGNNDHVSIGNRPKLDSRSVRRYTQEDLVKAIQAIHDGMSYKAASKEYGIPRVTLMYKHKGKVPLECRMGPAPVLTTDEEHTLADWLFHVSDRGFPATKVQLLDSVELLCKNLDRRPLFKNGRPGKKWFQSFLLRHPQITQRLSQNLSHSRSSATETKIRNWFEEVDIYLKQENLKDVFTDPRRVFNADETAFYLAPTGKKVLVRNGEKTVSTRTNSDDKDCLTTLITVNAAGMIAPLVIVFQYERIPANVIQLMPSDWAIGKSESGWMTGSTFFEFIANIFHPWLIKNGITLPVILFVDGHTSHLTLHLSNFCKEHGIVLVAFFPNSTHILQPLDVAVFHPLKSGWKNGSHEWRLENNENKLKNENFAPVLKKIIEGYVKAETISNGFRSCGLCPFDVNAIDFEKHFKNIPSAFTKTNGDPGVDFNKYFDYFESKIDKKSLETFKQSNHIWRGAAEDTNLFYLWKDFDNERNRTQPSLNKSTAIESIGPNELNKTVNSIPDNENVIDVVDEVRENSTTPQPSTSKEGLANIPTPFKKALFWPKPSKNLKTTSTKQKIPAVASSQQWLDYYSKKATEKLEIEEEKQQRKRVSEEKKKQSEEQKKRRMTEESSDSSTEMNLESDEDADENEFPGSANYCVGDHIIFVYDNDYYPGVVTEIKDSNYVVSSMVRSGINWRWPQNPDLCEYTSEDIQEKISAPRLISTRGVYKVVEMLKYD